MKKPDFATEKNRWYALIFLSLSLAIVIIDNNVLNVAIPYILRDLHTNFGAIQWVISGYALIIATILITVGRLGDAIGRKKLFLIGTGLFAIGSFIASIAPNVVILFIGEALIEAFGAAMMMTSSLALLVTEFQGRERAIAFGIWGSIAGASASLGPLLGGYLTTYYSWRWSLRINVIIAIVAILGSVFIQEAKGHKSEKFDWIGTLYSGLGLFLLVFGCIEGRFFGWLSPVQSISLFGWQWPMTSISIIPFVFALSTVFLALFVRNEYILEKTGNEPLMRLSLFANKGFTLGLITLGIVVMGQFGAFFIFPLYYQNVLGWNAFQTGLIFLWTSVTALIVGPASGVIASKFGPKWVVSIGMLASFIGIYMISNALSVSATMFTLAPSLVVLGIGIGMASAQLTNTILSHVPQQFSGEASAVNSTFRQIGTSIGIAVLGTVLASTLSVNITNSIQANASIPSGIRGQIASIAGNINAESGVASIRQNIPDHPLCVAGTTQCVPPDKIFSVIKTDVDQSLVAAAKTAFHVGLVFIAVGLICSLFIPGRIPTRKDFERAEKEQKVLIDKRL